MPNAESQRHLRFMILIGVFICAAGASADEPVIVTDISGHKINGALKSWSADKLIVAAESTQEIARTNVRSIAFEHPSKQAVGGQPTVWLSNGDRISARAVKVADDLLTVSWPLLGSMNPSPIALEKVVAIIFELPATMTDQYRLFADLDSLPPGSDVVMLMNGDRSTGEFQRLDSTFLELKAAANSLKLDRSRIRAIRLNPELTNAARSTGRRALLTLTDGSRLTVSSIESMGDVVKLKSPELGNLTVPLKNVTICSLFGESVIPITDYEPASIEFTPYLSTKWPLVRNANVWHGPLMLRGTEFATGLGTHSRMAVTYNLRGNEKEFQSVVGIDDVANGAGSAIFAIDVDGHRVWTSAELTGKSAMANVPEMSLRGSKRLTLLVDFGQFADVSDYADWCDAVLILDRSKEEN